MIKWMFSLVQPHRIVLGHGKLSAPLFFPLVRLPPTSLLAADMSSSQYQQLNNFQLIYNSVSL
jgi:hypothetical protein